MRVWHDWEFLENGITIKPISVGMVREDGAELYYEFANAPFSDIMKDEWMVKNVVPGLSGADGVLKSRLYIRDKVTQFLMRAAADSRTPLELWGWYSAYDHVCLAQLFGRMIDLPDWCPMLTRDLKQEFLRVGCDRSPYIPVQPEGKHNALADARHLKVKHEWFEATGWNAQNMRGVNVTVNNPTRPGFQLGNGNTQYNNF